jgi:hypothetical protein
MVPKWTKGRRSKIEGRGQGQWRQEQEQVTISCQLLCLDQTGLDGALLPSGGGFVQYNQAETSVIPEFIKCLKHSEGPASVHQTYLSRNFIGD